MFIYHKSQSIAFVVYFEAIYFSDAKKVTDLLKVASILVSDFFFLWKETSSWFQQLEFCPAPLSPFIFRISQDIQQKVTSFSFTAPCPTKINCALRFFLSHCHTSSEYYKRRIRGGGGTVSFFSSNLKLTNKAVCLEKKNHNLLNCTSCTYCHRIKFASYVLPTSSFCSVHAVVWLHGGEGNCAHNCLNISRIVHAAC